MSVYNLGRSFLEKHPSLIRISAHLYRLLNFNKKKVRGTHNTIECNASFLRKTAIDITGSDNGIHCGNKCYLDNCSIYIHGSSNKITIEDKVYLKDTEFYIEDNNNEIVLGEKTTISGRTHLACIEGTKIAIGRDCMFSSDVVVRTGDSHSIIDAGRKRINYSDNVVIGDHVWVGNKTIITKGSRIPDDSIVGTGSVVTGKFEQHGIVLGGNPARVIKENISWLRDRI